MNLGERFNALIDPYSREPLFQREEALCGEDGKARYAIDGRVAMLLDEAALSEEQRREQEVFDTLQLQGLPYFRPQAFQQALDEMVDLLDGAPLQRGVELGGGEGHFAAFVKQRFPQMASYVCDLSPVSLRRTREDLLPVFADITRPVFAPGSLDVAVFWVSLHHLNDIEQSRALDEVLTALRPGGLLMFYEPNAAFLPRHLVYRSAMARDVYMDEAEQAVDFVKAADLAQGKGLTLKSCRFISPPYNPAFVKKLKRWPLYLTVVEVLFRFHQLLIRPFRRFVHTPSPRAPSRFFTLYGAAIFQKEAA